MVITKKSYATPVRVFLEDMGYNYVVAFGQLLTDQWFKSATEFNEEGYAIVVNRANQKMRIDREGHLTRL